MKKVIPVFLMAILALSMVYATCSFVTPTNGGIMRGTTQLLNVSGCTFATPMNCSISASSALTADSASYVLKNTTNWMNATIDSTADTDASDWVLSGTCMNSSNAVEAITSITVTVDNTVPTCTWASGIVSQASYKQSQVWSITGTNGVSGVITFGNNGQQTMTENSDVFTYTGLIPEATYDTVSATISDGLNSTSCSLTSVQIDNAANLVQVAANVAVSKSANAKQTQAAQANNSRMLFLIVIIGVGIYFMRKKK